MEMFSLCPGHKRQKAARRRDSYCHQAWRAVVISSRSLGSLLLAMVCALFVLLVFLFLLLASHLPGLSFSMPDVASAGPDDIDIAASAITLLVWWLPFGNRHPFPDCLTSHNVPGCTITSDRSAYGVADAVILHHRELMFNRDDLPHLPRPPGQKWVWMNFESPSHSGQLEKLDGMFNLTMSYRLGSDIFLPYGYLQWRRYRDDRNPGSWKMRMGRKRGLVAWVISNWSEQQERVRYYQKLRRYLHIDVYGRQARRLVNDSVVQTVSTYKFYLSFENSLHTDYITEKLWRNALLSGAVPVVLGPSRENYERFLPADAFIHVDDFKGPRALAAYLAYLDHNPAQYRRYLAWRQDYSVHLTSFWSEQYCATCQAVRASRHQNKTINHLSLWFES